MENEIVILDSVEKFNRHCGFETLHPLVSIVDMSQSKNDFGRSRMNYGIYALWLKNGVGCSLKYGRRHYDYAEGTVVSFAPGQMVQAEPTNTNAMPQSIGLLIHPDLIHGTALSRKMERYTFFSYDEAEALHLSERDLLGSTLSVSEIAYNLGFDYPQHFTRLFKKQTGLSPTEYRNQIN